MAKKPAIRLREADQTPVTDAELRRKNDPIGRSPFIGKNESRESFTKGQLGAWDEGVRGTLNRRNSMKVRADLHKTYKATKKFDEMRKGMR